METTVVPTNLDRTPPGVWPPWHVAVEATAGGVAAAGGRRRRCAVDSIAVCTHGSDEPFQDADPCLRPRIRRAGPDSADTRSHGSRLQGPACISTGRPIDCRAVFSQLRG